MTIRRSLVPLLLTMLVGASLVGCVRSISSDGLPSTQESVGEGASGATDDIMEQIWQLATQTAIAQQGPAGGQATTVPVAGNLSPTATPEVVIPTEEPTPTPLPTMVPVPTATPGIPASYTLEGGEHIFCIARRFNVDPGALLSLNGLGPNSFVYSGMTLNIPQAGQPFPGDRALLAHPTTHTVTSGETLNSIACKYGDIDPNSIAIANGLTAPYQITPGQTIQIP